MNVIILKTRKKKKIGRREKIIRLWFPAASNIFGALEPNTLEWAPALPLHIIRAYIYTHKCNI